MKKIVFILFLTCSCLVTGCAFDREDGDLSQELDATVAAQGKYVYFISRKGQLCCFTIADGKMWVVSENSGSIFQTPWDVLFVQKERVGRLIEGELHPWLKLPEGTLFASATEDGCYAVKQIENSDTVEVYYTSETESRIVTVLQQKREDFLLLKLYAVGDGFYYEDGTSLHYRRGEEDCIVETALLQEICQGREGIAYLKAAAEESAVEPSPFDEVDSRVCDLYYRRLGTESVCLERLAAEKILYANGHFVTVGGRVYSFLEEALETVPLHLKIEHSYTVSKSCMSELGLISRIAYEDCFCYQGFDREEIFDFSETNE